MNEKFIVDNGIKRKIIINYFIIFDNEVLGINKNISPFLMSVVLCFIAVIVFATLFAMEKSVCMN